MDDDGGGTPAPELRTPAAAAAHRSVAAAHRSAADARTQVRQQPERRRHVGSRACVAPVRQRQPVPALVWRCTAERPSWPATGRGRSWRRA